MFTRLHPVVGIPDDEMFVVGSPFINRRALARFTLPLDFRHAKTGANALLLINTITAVEQLDKATPVLIVTSTAGRKPRFARLHPLH